VVERVGELVEGGEWSIGDGFVGERPEMFGGLQFRGVGRQEAEPDARGDAQPLAEVPAGPVEQQDDGLVRAGAERRCESVEDALEQRNIDRRYWPATTRPRRLPVARSRRDRAICTCAC